MEIEVLKKPKIVPPEMVCDKPLAKKLDNFELTSYLNSHSTNLLLGKPKSGKSSLMWSFLKSPKILNKVFNNVYLFQPSHSRASIKNDIFKKHPKDKKFDELTFDNFMEVIERIKATDKKENNCIIFDDMSAYLKNKQTLQLFKELIFNRRHLRCSIYFLNQTFFSVPKELRRLFSNMFIFKCSKNEMNNVFEEVVEDDNIKKLLPSIMRVVYDKPYQFLFINLDNQKFYKGFDRIKFKCE
tara:strand:+ start:8392 stop:9114 length:723 start_codon:yes stop_codon:yes gene_type:complete